MLGEEGYGFSIGLCHCQCDQIGRFIGLEATFQSLWQQLICPNTLHSLGIFVKVSKSLIFLVKSFLGNFYRYLATFYWSHWPWPRMGLSSREGSSVEPSMRNFFIGALIYIRCYCHKVDLTEHKGIRKESK